MKKLFTMLVVFLCSTTISFAQSGTFVLGAGSDMAGVSWQNYSIKPTVGYFVSDKMLVGTGFAMESGDETDDKMTLSPYLRYYLSGSLYAKAGMTLETEKDEDSVVDVDAGVGLSLMWNDKVAIEPGFGFSFAEDAVRLALNIGISIRLGMDK